MQIGLYFVRAGRFFNGIKVLLNLTDFLSTDSLNVKVSSPCKMARSSLFGNGPQRFKFKRLDKLVSIKNIVHIKNIDLLIFIANYKSELDIVAIFSTPLPDTLISFA